jgi:hypothetical protein
MPKSPEELAAEAAAKLAADKAAAEAAAKEAAKAAHLAEHGYPLETPVADMPAEQQAAYWRHEAKKQQKKTDGVDIAKLQADAAELAALKAASATDQDKALEEARREGEVIGAEKYLKGAVKGSFRALTGMSKEDVETAFAHVDASSFTGADGAIDDEKLEQFAATFGQNAGGAPGSIQDPVAEALRRQQAGGGGGNGNAGSVADIKAQRKELLAPSKK